MLPLIVILPEIVTVPVESDKIQSRSSLPLLLIEIDAADKKPSPTAIVVFIVPPVVGPVIVIAPPTTNVPGEAIVNVLVLFSVLLIIKLAQTAPATEMVGLLVTFGMITTPEEIGTTPVFQFVGVFQSVFVAPVQVCPNPN